MHLRLPLVAICTDGFFFDIYSSRTPVGNGHSCPILGFEDFDDS